MTDRTVKVSLLAEVNNYVSNMEKSNAVTRKAANESKDLKQKLDLQTKAMQEVGRGMVAIGALALVGVALAVKKFTDFDAAISNVKAATQETTENMGLLRDAALVAGADSVFTATEAANAIEELGKAGLSTADILSGALMGSLNLASAGELDIARAAEIASTTLSQFNLAGTQTGHVADVLAAGAGKALGSVDDLANGLKFVGPLASDMGVSLEETTGVLALFAQQGILGEQAGTSLRGMISSLTSPSKLAAAEIENLGINLYDLSTGAFLGLENAAGQLENAYAGMTAGQRDMSLGILFGNEQMTAARVLYTAGAEGVAEWTAEVNDSGYAAKVAADRLDNLSGDVEKLGGAFDTYLIKSGSGANDILRLFVQTATGVVDVLGEMPEPVLAVGLGLVGLTAIVGLTGGGFLLALPKVAAFKASLIDVGISGRSAAVGIGVASGALAAATVIIGYFAAKQGEAVANTAEFKDSLDGATGAVTNYTRELVAKKLAESGAFGAAKEAGITQRELTDAVLEGGEALAEVQKKLTGANSIANFFNFTESGAISAGMAQQSLRDLSGAVVDSKQDFEDQKAAADEAAEGTHGAADAYKDAADKAATLQSNLSALIDTINKANGVGQDAVSTNASYRQAMDAAAASVAEYAEANGISAANIDESTAAGSANAEMFADLAAKSQDAAKAQFDLDGNTSAYIANLNGGKQALYDQIVALTDNADAAQALTDKIYSIPSEKEVKILTETAAAQTQLDEFFTLNNGRVIYAHVEGSLRGGFADGGYTGPGGKYQPAGIVHAGEFVSTQETLSKPSNRAALEFMHRGGVIRGYAGGGLVQPQFAQQSPWRMSPAGGGDKSITIQQDIQGGDGMSGSEVAQIAADRIAFALKGE